MYKHNSEHINSLKHLWHTVFGDAPSVIDAYFDAFYSPDLTAVEYADGELAGAAYVMPAGELVNGDSKSKCAHIYAVAVYPEFRGRGFGITVTNRAVDLAKKAGFTAVVLHPAEESLFGYYEKHCGFKTCFSADTKSGLSGENLTPTDTETYQSCREKFLKDIPHIALSRDILDFFQKCGGTLYTSETGCAAVENIDGTAYYREALGGFCADTPNSVFSCPGRSIATGMIHESADFDFGWMGLTLE